MILSFKCSFRRDFHGIFQQKNMFDDNVGPGKIAPSQVGNRLDYWGHEKNFRCQTSGWGGETTFLCRLHHHHHFVGGTRETRIIINIVIIVTYQFVLWRLIFVDDLTVFDAQIRHHDLCCLNVVQWKFSVNLACKFLKNIGYNMVQHPSIWIN